jgi:hypothetical protein
MDGIACSWLPEDIAKAAAEEEPKRFSALISRFSSVAEDASASADLNAWAPVVQWIPLLNKCVRCSMPRTAVATCDIERLHSSSFLLARKDYDIADVQRLTEALLMVVMRSSSDLEVQVSSVGITPTPCILNISRTPY